YFEYRELTRLWIFPFYFNY
ncbi:hypothetical protein VCHC60A1_2531B, partial [Vibrio cholerae HC-60A1]